MDMRPNALRKAIANQSGSKKRIEHETRDDRSIREQSKDRYRAFVDSINKTGDRDIERALKHA